MSDTLNEVLKSLKAIEANQELILAELGLAKHSKRFIRKDETKASEQEAKEEAKPLTLRELWKKAKASLKRRGLVQQHYASLKARTKGKKLIGDDYFKAYVACYEKDGYTKA